MKEGMKISKVSNYELHHFCEFIIFFISSPIELEGKDAIMKRNNSNDALSFF